MTIAIKTINVLLNFIDVIRQPFLSIDNTRFQFCLLK